MSDKSDAAYYRTRAEKWEQVARQHVAEGITTMIDRDQLQADYLKLRDELGAALHDADKEHARAVKLADEVRELRAECDRLRGDTNIGDVLGDLFVAERERGRLRTQRDTARGTAARLMEIAVAAREWLEYSTEMCGDWLTFDYGTADPAELKFIIDAASEAD